MLGGGQWMCLSVCVCVVEHACVRGRWEASGSQDAVVTGKSGRSHNLVIHGDVDTRVNATNK